MPPFNFFCANQKFWSHAPLLHLSTLRVEQGKVREDMKTTPRKQHWMLRGRALLHCCLALKVMTRMKTSTQLLPLDRTVCTKPDLRVNLHEACYPLYLTASFFKVFFYSKNFTWHITSYSLKDMSPGPTFKVLLTVEFCAYCFRTQILWLRDKHTLWNQTWNYKKFLGWIFSWISLKVHFLTRWKPYIL